MSRRRGGGASVAANPVLIGAATMLVIIVAVFLAYTANNGLPFVPTYELEVQVPNAANLVEGNDVRLAGTRVGVVDRISAKQLPGGAVVAVLHLKLQTSVQKLAKDSSFLIRSRSALGLKYVQITEGRSKNGFPSGATVPPANAKPAPVEIDEVLNTFDEPTRRAQQRNLLELGNALAGRGRDVNTLLGELNPLLRVLLPVARNLADPRTGLEALFPALGRTAAVVAPAADTQASLFRNLDRTFIALSDVARPFIGETIERGPETLDTAIASFRAQRPFLANAEGLFRDLRPGVAALSRATPDLADALDAGTPALRRSNELNTRLADTFRTLRDFASSPVVPIGLADLIETVTLLDEPLASLTPAQVTCNYLTLWFRNVASLLSEGDRNGTWQRFIIIATPLGPNNEGGPSSAPASGPGQDNYLHSNPYPNVGASDQPDECEAANEAYLKGRTVIGNVPGTQSNETEATEIDRGTP